MAKKNAMTSAAAKRIKSANAKQGDGTTQKGSFAARAESAAAKNSGQKEK
jgi:hypothetical protein